MPKAYPKSSVLKAYRAQSLPWWKRIAELIDNSLDAGATRVTISFRKQTLSVSDDGCGAKDPVVLVTLGDHVGHGSPGLGMYGIGAKDAWLCTGPVIEIDSVHRGERRYLKVDARQMEKSDWDIPDVEYTPSDQPSGTTIKIGISGDQNAPQWQSLTERLGWVFAPGLHAGKQILFADAKLPLVPTAMPPLDNCVTDTFEIDGKPVSICIGMRPSGAKIFNGPFWLQYRHRTIDRSTLGTNGRANDQLAGTITLGDGWKLAKNKDALLEVSDALAEAIHQRIAHLLEMCEHTAEQIHTEAIQTELEAWLNDGLKGTKREKRQAGESTGTQHPAFTGRKRQRAEKTTDKPGSVIALDGQAGPKRKGFHLSFAESDPTVLGFYDATAKTVSLNSANDVIRTWRRRGNRPALFSAVGAILANHDATMDGPQRLLGCAVGDFLGSYTKLVTSVVDVEVHDANDD